MCAEDNMTIARPSTPASYFHLLRRQAYARPRRPLVVFTPKAMLRLRGATSGVEAFTSGRFEPVLDCTRVQDPSATKRIVLHSGKIHYDLTAELDKRGVQDDIALVRLEQLYPLPLERIREVLSRYPSAELVWAQEEPENQGAWPFVVLELQKHLDRRITVASRPASASPAAGSTKASAAQQTELIRAALTL
jgi:2-oxoglutarate decarboxylase